MGNKIKVPRNVNSLKTQLNELNFNKGNISISNKGSDAFLDQYEVSQTVEDDVKTIIRKINKYNSAMLNANEKIHLGAISSGAHSIDFANYFGFNIDDSWNFSPILFVYECPGNNLDATFLAEESSNLIEDYRTIEQNSLESNIHKLLGNRIWHVYWNENKNGKPNTNLSNNNFKFFEAKKVYSEFLLSLILEFKLGNLYTTNFFRYEIFHIKKDEEKSLNLSKIKGLKIPDSNSFPFNYMPKAFVEELNKLKPHAIFSSSGPINDIKNAYKENVVTTKRTPSVIQVPHPAAYGAFLKRRDRFIQNTFNVIYGLYNAGVIKKEEAYDKMAVALEKYKEVI